jgi:iron complex transport system ATP-binding protein
VVASLRAASVEFAYPGPVHALAGVDFELRRGELVAVLGPNGSGKTTLLRLLSGIVRPQRGRIELDGQDLRRLGHARRARSIAVVPQGLSAIPEVSVRDFVGSGRYGHLGFLRVRTPHDRAVVDAAMAETEVLELGDRLLGELSGGQRQRVLIARALAQEADLVLLDEPTASLDPEHQVRLLELVRSLVHRGKGAALVTHDLNHASVFADRLHLLHEGRTAAVGTPDAVLRARVLDPVYGRCLWFARFPGSPGAPLVVPWRAPATGEGIS